MNLARLCARLKPVFLSKKGPSKARLLTKMSSSEELGTLLTVSKCETFGPIFPIIKWYNIKSKNVKLLRKNHNTLTGEPDRKKTVFFLRLSLP